MLIFQNIEHLSNIREQGVHGELGASDIEKSGDVYKYMYTSVSI